jgi:hypothetical protein
MALSRGNATPPKGSPATAQPAVFDTLIQSSAVALFHAYGVAAAPLTPAVVRPEDFAPHYPLAAIGLKAPNIDATLILSVPQEICAQVRMGQQRLLDGRELLRELVNQAAGRIKNRLIQYQVTVRCGLPSVADRDLDLDRVAPQRGPITLYRLRTIYGHVLVALKGTVDPSALVYSTTTVLNAEGDIIVF